MKALISLVLLLLLGAGGYYVFVVLPAEDDPGGAKATELPSPPLVKNGTATTDPGGELEATGKVPPPVRPSAESEADGEAKRRALWAKLRPPRERLLPDPDNVGPCPADGRANPVVQRYLDPGNGFRVWKHDDGSYTYLHPNGGGEIDPGTGRRRPIQWMVTTLVPAESQPIVPDELPPGSEENPPDKTGGGDKK